MAKQRAVKLPAWNLSNHNIPKQQSSLSSIQTFTYSSLRYLLHLIRKFLSISEIPVIPTRHPTIFLFTYGTFLFPWNVVPSLAANNITIVVHDIVSVAYTCLQIFVPQPSGTTFEMCQDLFCFPSTRGTHDVQINAVTAGKGFPSLLFTPLRFHFLFFSLLFAFLLSSLANSRGNLPNTWDSCVRVKPHGMHRVSAASQPFREVITYKGIL